MKTKLTFLSALLLFATWAGAQNSILMKYLPSGVNTVVTFSPLKLASKIPGETFRQSAMYRELMKNDKGEIRAFLSDPSISGIDLSAGLFIVITTDTTSAYPGAMVSMMGVLKNEALFSLMVNKLKGEDDSLRTYGTNRMMLTETSKPAIAWNDEIFVMTNGRTADMRMQLMTIFSDTTDQRTYEDRMREFNETILKSKRDHCFELLTPKNINQHGHNERLNEMFNATGDIKIWSNEGGISQSMLKRLPAQILPMMAKLKAATGNEKITLVNFENGKISSATKAYPGKAMAAAHEKYPSGPVNTSLLQQLPAGSTLLGAMAFSTNPALGKEMMQQSGLSELLDSLKDKIPFDTDLLTSSFGSDGLFALLKTPAKEMTVSENEDERSLRLFDGLDFIVAIPIKDKEKFERLKRAMSHMLDSLKETEAGEKYLAGFKPAVKYNDKLFVLSMKEETAAAYLNNPATTAVPVWATPHITSPMIGMLNFREFLTMMLRKEMQEIEESGEEDGIKKMTGILDKIVFSGGNYNNGAMSSNMEMLFGNPDKNAMEQLFDLLNLSLEQSEKRKRRYENDGPPPAEEKIEMTVPNPNDKNAPGIVRDTDVKVEIVEIKQEETIPPPPPPPPPAKPEVKKKTTTVKKKN